MWLTIWLLYSLLISLSGYVQLIPGPKRVYVSNISICHWNLNSASAQNYTKLFHLKTYNAIHKFDVFANQKHNKILALLLMMII